MTVLRGARAGVRRSRAAPRAARSADDVPRRRARGLAGGTADQRRNRRRAEAGVGGRRAGHDARRRIERARVRRGRARTGHQAARRRSEPSWRPRASARMPRSRSTGWCDGRSLTAAPASKPGRERRERLAAASTATRISAAASSAIWSPRCVSPSRDGAVSDVPRAAMAFAYDRSRLQQTGEVLLSAVFQVSDGEPASLRATSARVAGVSKTHAASRCAKRRLYFSEP